MTLSLVEVRVPYQLDPKRDLAVVSLALTNNQATASAVVPGVSMFYYTIYSGPDGMQGRGAGTGSFPPYGIGNDLDLLEPKPLILQPGETVAIVFNILWRDEPPDHFKLRLTYETMSLLKATAYRGVPIFRDVITCKCDVVTRSDEKKKIWIIRPVREKGKGTDKDRWVVPRSLKKKDSRPS